MEDIESLVTESMRVFGGKFDFILHSIGMSPNVRKGIPYEQTNYENMLKTFDISALSFHRILQTAYKFDAINEWGSVVALSYVAAQRTLTGYNDMGDAKALLESITRSFGYIYGRDRKVRINTISQSPTPTTAGSGIHGFESLIDFSERMSPLGNATAEECADYCVVLFSDLTRKVTMQNLYHDGGFSSMGMSLKAIEQYKKSFEECDCDKK
jgi:enoyl-[acyl-carrier protein] reductase I